MAMRSSIRSASRVTRSRPTLSSRLPGRPHPKVPFSSIHTTSQNPQAAAAAALAQDTNDALPARETARTPSQAPATFAELQKLLPAWSSKAEALSRQIHQRHVRFRNSLRYEILLPDRQRVLVTRPYNAKVPPRFLDAIYLRDRCVCPQCVSPSSGNKSFSTAEIPGSLEFESVAEEADGSLHIRWKNDIPRFCADGRTHVSVFPPTNKDSINQLLMEKPEPFAPLKLNYYRYRYERQLWDKEILTPRLQTVKYKNFMAGGDAFRKVVRELAVTGLVFIKDMPPTEDAVAEVALQFGAIKETFYGRTWNVMSKPEAENVAYTSSYLGLHSDMLYLESPPRIQLLHCLRNSCPGGESIFSDAFHAASKLRERSPRAADVLSRILVPYHYSKNGFFYQQRRPVFDFSGETPDTHEVWWSPPFQAPFHLPVSKTQTQVFRSWHQSATQFQAILEDESNMFEYKLKPGECVLFDNRRVLHGRREFDASSGRRWLKGTYVANEDFVSMLNRVYLEEKQSFRQPQDESESGVEYDPDTADFMSVLNKKVKQH